jgi:hypothetical protein
MKRRRTQAVQGEGPQNLYFNGSNPFGASLKCK